jgi:hypothetical protein
MDEGATGQTCARADGNRSDTRPAVLDQQIERGLDEGLAGRRRSFCLGSSRHLARLPDKYIYICIIQSRARFIEIFLLTRWSESGNLDKGKIKEAKCRITTGI